VSRFAALGIAALNYGPGDPNLAHTREEHVDPEKIIECTRVLRRYLTVATTVDASPIDSRLASS
jgi:succinyl-diaminopimelate desuccinylase